MTLRASMLGLPSTLATTTTMMRSALAALPKPVQPARPGAAPAGSTRSSGAVAELSPLPAAPAPTHLNLLTAFARNGIAPLGTPARRAAAAAEMSVG
jgi:hypothetical protein